MTRYSDYLALIVKHSQSNIGYSQPRRWTWLDKANKRIVSGKEGDCSAVTMGLAWLAGYPIQSAYIAGSQTCYTGNAYAIMNGQAKWPAVSVKGWSVAQINAKSSPGDMLLKDGHIMVKYPATSGHKWYSMNIDENGRISGGLPGDQTGNESSVRDLWMPSVGWTYLFQVPDKSEVGESTTPSPAGTPSVIQATTPTPPAGLTSGTTLVANPSTNVRTGPATTYGAVGTLPPNTLVTGELVNGWIKITKEPAAYLGRFVSTNVLGTVTTSPPATSGTGTGAGSGPDGSTPGQAGQGGASDSTPSTTTPSDTTDDSTPPEPEPTPPPAQTQDLYGLFEADVRRLQRRLSERGAAGLPVTGKVDDATLKAWQTFLGVPATGTILAPDPLVKAIQIALNRRRSAIIGAGGKVNASWGVVPENGLWDFSTATAVRPYLLYSDSMAKPS